MTVVFDVTMICSKTLAHSVYLLYCEVALILCIYFILFCSTGLYECTPVNSALKINVTDIISAFTNKNWVM